MLKITTILFILYGFTFKVNAQSLSRTKIKSDSIAIVNMFTEIRELMQEQKFNLGYHKPDTLPLITPITYSINAYGDLVIQRQTTMGGENIMLLQKDKKIECDGNSAEIERVKQLFYKNFGLYNDMGSKKFE